MRTFTQKMALWLMTLLCCVAMPQAVMAQDCLVIGEGTAHSSWYLPVANYYHNCYSQQLFLADELEMGASQITSIAFQYDNYTSSLTRTISVFMANTDAADLSSAFVTEGLQEVLSATVFTFDPNDDWSTIELETPFAYDGTSNLVVAVYMNYSSAETSYTGGYRFAQTAMTGMARYVSNDTSSPDQIALVNNAPTAAGTAVGYRCNVQFCYTTGGQSGPVCDKPESLDATGVGPREATLNWAGGGSNIYDVEYKLASADKWTVAASQTTNTSVLIQNLEPNTSYNARVHCVCPDTISGWKTLNFKTLIGLPYGENFDNLTAKPAEWEQKAGLLSDVLAGGSLTSGSNWSFSSSTTGVFESKHMYINIYGTARKNWLILPSVPIEDNVQLTFTMALTKSSTAYTEIATTGVDDKFVVLASIDNGATWTILRQWDNDSSEYVYNNIALYGEEVAIDLSAYATQSVQIAFYGESTQSNADNYLHIDDVLIDYVPSCLKPNNLSEVPGSATKSSLQVEWEASNGEQNWRIQYKKKADAEWNEAIDITSNPYTITGLESFTEYSIRVAAFCDPTDETTLTDFTKPITLKTAAGVPFHQGFTASSLPSEWKRYKGLWEEVLNGEELSAVTAGWTPTAKASANNVFPDSARHLVLNVKDSTCYWVVSPTIEMEAGYQLTFDLALTAKAGTTPTPVAQGQQNDKKFIVAVFDPDLLSWIALRQWNGTAFDEINATAAGQMIKIGLDAYVGKAVKIAFYGESTETNIDCNLHISNMNIDLVPDCENSTSLNLDAQGTTATASWDLEEGATWQYFYRLKPEGEFTPTDEMFVHTTGERSVVISGLSETTTYTFYLRRQCGENTYSEIMSRDFTTIQTPANLPFEDTFEDGNHWLLVNGSMTNAWAWGTATAKDGTHALYVSNDNGLSNAYTNNSAAMVYATKTFYFDEVGTYIFSYDWKATGESTFDYLRVALVGMDVEPAAAATVPTGFSASALPTGWIALDGGAKLNLQSEWQHQSVQIEITQVGYKKVVLAWRDDTSGGSNPPAAIDNFSISRMACPTPSGLQISEVAANSAVIAWNDPSDGTTWVYAVAPASEEEPADEAYAPIAVASVSLTDLAECTSYKFYLRMVCGSEFSETASIPFQTTQLPLVLGNHYVEDFESGNGWLFYNLETNAWVIDTAANNGGEKALYVSQDGGLTNTYYKSTGGLIFASKMFTFEDANYNFQFDWRAAGEGTSTIYDYVRVALVPAGTELAAKSGTSGYPSGYSATGLPANWIALDGGYLNLHNAWTTVNTMDVPVTAGDYMVVFGWRWDTSGGSDPAAAIDNFSINKVLCATPANLQVVADSIMVNAAFIKWDEVGENSNYLVRYKKSDAEEWTLLNPMTVDSVWLTGLDASTVYEVQVAAWCDPTDEETISEFSASVSFATACAAIEALNEDFEDVNKLICWSLIQESNSYPALKTGAEYATSGTKSLYFLSMASGTPVDQYAILPELVSLDGLRIKFNARKEEDTDEDTYAVVGVMTDPADASTFVYLDSLEITSTTYAQFAVPFAAYTGAGKYIAIMMPAAQSSYATILVDDVVVEEVPNCLEPLGPVAVVDVTAETATLAWPAEENGAWKYAFAPASAAEPADEAFVAITDTLITIDELEDCTPYTFYLRRDCGSMMSPSITATFTTLLKVATVPYADDFETANKWMFINGNLTNAWAYGEAAHNGEGTHAIYISNDNGVSNAYTVNSPAVVYAVKSFHFEEGTYVFQYDWRCMGEGTSTLYDYLRVALVPDSIEFEASTTLPTGVTYQALPEGIIALDGGKALNQKSAWETFRSDAITIAEEGDYKVVLLWRDDTSSGTQTPAAVDNFSIEKLNCIRPDSLIAVAETATTTSIQLDWQPISGENFWFVQYKKSADDQWILVPDSINTHPFTLTGLEASNTYDVRVAAWCDPTDSTSASEYSLPIEITTKCEAITAFPYEENFDGIAGVTSGHVLPICWSHINTCTYSTYSYYPTTYKSTSYSKSGENSLRFYSYYYNSTTTNYDPQDQYAILPEMENISGLRLKFSARAYSTTANSGQYTIGVMTNPADTATFVPVYEGNLTSTSYQSFDIKLNRYQGEGRYIAIKMPAAGTPTTRGLYIDDIVVEQLPSCIEPENVVINEFTATTATISWTNGAEGQNAWQVVYSTDGEFDPNEATPIDVLSNPCSLANLTPETNYYLYVRANCSEGETVDYSAWSAKASFRTASQCQTPDNLSADEITVNSAAISWNTYGQTGFNLRYGTDGATWTVVNNAEMPYTINDLATATAYYVQVQAACADADVWSAALNFKTAYGIPFEETFDATSIPADWSRYSGLVNSVLDGTATLATTTSGWNFATGNGVFDTHAKINIWGTSARYWLVTPNIFISENVQLTFDLALTKYSGTLDEIIKTLGEDDRFVVLVSTNNGDTWTIIREWNNTGSEYVYNDISFSADGEPVAINLSDYSGQQIKIAFYGESTVSETGSDNNLHVDNVSIDLVPTCLKPTALNISEVKAHSAKLAWESDAAAWQIAIDTIAAFNPDTLSELIDATEKPYVVNNLAPEHTYYVYVRANCGEQDGVSRWTARGSFTTTVACPAPANLKATLTPGNGSIATLTWDAGEAQAWQVEYSLNADMSDSLVLNVEVAQADLINLTAEQKYYARVKADCGELDGESVYSAIISFTPSNIFSITINEGTTTNEFVPIYGYWADNYTRSQFIIPAADLEAIEWDTITQLTFYISSNVNLGAAEFEAYMAEADETTISGLKSWDALTKVMDAASLTIADNKMVVTLSAPFVYEGGNLLIGFKQTVVGSSPHSYWYGVSATGASFSGYENQYGQLTAQQRNFLPKMTIEYIEGVAPACIKPKHLAKSDITDAEATLTWDAVEGATWQYAVVPSTVMPTEADAQSTTDNFVQLSLLNENTNYTFYLRRDCGEDGYSEIVYISFTTDVHVEAVPFEDNFEATSAWKLINGEQANAWVIGGAEFAGGDKSLYISNNGGAANAYTFDAQTAVYATLLLSFPEDTTYVFQYDWKSYGEYDPDEQEAYDYLRVALAPASVEPAAGEAPYSGLTDQALPAGWVALDGEHALYEEDAWQHVNKEIDLTAGQYKVVIAWINDEAEGQNAPAAIDNFSIRMKDTETGINGGAAIDTKAIKFIRNNHVYILVNGVMYDATGRRVK